MSHLRVPSLAPSAAETLAAEPALAWSAPTGRAAAGPPVVGDSIVAVLTTEGSLVVVSRSSGAKIWRRRLAGAGVGGPLVQENRIYCSSADGRTYAFDVRRGGRAWVLKSGPLVGPMAASDGRLFLATAAGQVLALDAAKGSVLWRRDLEQVVRSGPVVAGDRVVVASDDSLFALAVADGARLSAVPARGMGLNPPAQSDSLLVYASPDGGVAAFDGRTLRPAWRVETGEPVLGSAVVARDTAFAVTSAGTLWVIPLAAPAAATSVALGVAVRATPAPISDGVIVATITGEILRIAFPGREPRWKTRVDGPVEQPPVVDRGLLVFVDGRGRIQAWR